MDCDREAGENITGRPVRWSIDWKRSVYGDITAVTSGCARAVRSAAAVDIVCGEWAASPGTGRGDELAGWRVLGEPADVAECGETVEAGASCCGERAWGVPCGVLVDVGSCSGE